MINSLNVKACATDVHLKLADVYAIHSCELIINDCLLRPMLHVNHPLLQFADIMDPLLITAALFSRFYSHMIQT